MPLRTSNRRSLALARKQRKYRIESDSDDEDDGNEIDTESSSSVKFGGVLATLKNNDKNLRNQRKKSNERGNCKNRPMSSPVKISNNEQRNISVEENGLTPPPRSIIMTRSAMRAISPLTTQKPRQGEREVRESSVKECSHADSFASDHDHESRHPTLSSSEKSKSYSSSSRDSRSSGQEDQGEEYSDDSFGDSQSSSEFEFGLDDEEFIPDDEDEEDDESTPMSDFIVDDASDEFMNEKISNVSPAAKSDRIDEDDVGVHEDDGASKGEDRCNDTSVHEEINPYEQEDKDICIESETFEDSDNLSQYASMANCDVTVNSDSGNVVETPAKTVSPRRTLNFSSPEPQMAIVVDDNEDIHDDGDIMVATIIENDTIDGDTIVLTFDEDEEELDFEKDEAASNCNEEVNKSVSGDMDSEVQAKVESHVLVSSSERRISSDDQQNRMTEEKDNQTDLSGEDNLKTPAPRKNITKKQVSKQYRQEGEVKRGKWALGAKIGVGSFGQVHVGMNTQTGVLMAVKKFKMEGAIMQDIRTEVELMRSLSHKNIVRYIGAQMDNDFLHIFQEWVPGGSVSSLLSKFGSFSLEVIQSYISQTLEGLSYLHDNNIIHRDIKGSNILINDEGVVKLADFGASKKLKNLAANMMMSLTVRGTPYFMAPEVFEEKYGAKADIWGIGCVAYQMVTTRPPWKELGFSNPISLFNHIKKTKGSPTMEHPQKESFSKRQNLSWTMLEAFVSRCFEQDPSERPSAKDLLDDPFVSQLSDSHFDDDVSVHYRGLFSPSTSISPNQSSSKSKTRLPTSGNPEKYKQEMTRVSPCPESGEEREILSFAKKETPSKLQKIQDSPPPDTRAWPDWAKKQFDYKQKDQSECKETSQDNISELMDSLALSDDSTLIGQKLSMERRSSSIGSSTMNSNLVGLKFLDSTKSNPRK